MSRIVLDTTGACGFRAVGASVDGTNVIRGWFNLAGDYPGVTIQSVQDANNTIIGGLMFNSRGALVNTCAAVPFPIGYVDVNVSGGQSKATAYAQQMLEQLKNQTFNPGPLNQTDTPEPGYTRTWTIAQEPGTNPPNRLARIQVTVVWTRGDRSQTVTLETMRAE